MNYPKAREGNVHHVALTDQKLSSLYRYLQRYLDTLSSYHYLDTLSLYVIFIRYLYTDIAIRYLYTLSLHVILILYIHTVISIRYL